MKGERRKVKGERGRRKGKGERRKGKAKGESKRGGFIRRCLLPGLPPSEKFTLLNEVTGP